MAFYIHIDEDGRIDGVAPEFNEDGSPNILPADLELGWFKWPFEQAVPEDFDNYKIVDGELVYDPVPEAIDTTPTIEELVDAIMELAELVGGE